MPPLVITTGTAASASLRSQLRLRALLDLDASPGQVAHVLMVLLVVGIPDQDGECLFGALVVTGLCSCQKVSIYLERNGSAEQYMADDDLCVRHAYHILLIVKNCVLSAL